MLKEVLRKKMHFLCQMLLKFIFLNFLYYFGHIENVFLFLIYFSGGLFDMVIIDFHWKVLHFSFAVKTFLTWQKKKFSQLSHACLRLLCLCIYEHIWIFIENWNPFCMGPLCLLLWILYKYYFGMMCWMPSNLKVV